MPGSRAVLASPAENPELSGQGAEASSSEAQSCWLWAESLGRSEGLDFSVLQTLDFSGVSWSGMRVRGWMTRVHGVGVGDLQG